MKGKISNSLSRRRFIEYLAGSPFYGPLSSAAFFPGTGVAAGEQSPADTLIQSANEAFNLFDFIPVARKKIRASHWAYLMTGSDDNLTVQANRDGFLLFQIRARRFIDVENVDTSVEVFGQRYPSPIMLAPIGSQKAFHSEGELAVARAARSKRVQMILSTLTTSSLHNVTREYQQPIWFQLYPTSEWEVTRQLIEQAERAHCPVLVITADTPVPSNREMQKRAGSKTQSQCRVCHEPGSQGSFRRLAMFQGIDVSGVDSPAHPITWDLINRIRGVTRMKLVIKGIVTAEDAELCVRHGIDGVVVSNHGGRQEESLLSTIEVLPEVVKAVNGKIPVLIDSGIRRGTDVFKALALGATAVCIGRPYVWGLGAFGQAGVEQVLELLRAELVVTMKMAGTTSISNLTPNFIRKRYR